MKSKLCSPPRLATLLSTLMMIAAIVCSGAQPEPAKSALPMNLPNPLRLQDGTIVTTKEQWLTIRRPELKELFQRHMYGFLPPAVPIRSSVEREDRNYFGGKATRKEIIIHLGLSNAAPIHLLAVIPNQRTGPAPVILGLNFCGNHVLLEDPTITLPTRWMPKSCPGCPENKATDAGRGKQKDTFAIEQIVERGYALATFYHGDLEPDRTNATEGIRAVMKSDASGKEYDWGTIAAWAWGIQRSVDYLLTDRNIDPKRIAVFGHSRNGKTALLAGALDERIALVFPHQAGCGGTAPSRGKIGESVKQINDRFPHWFNAEFKKFNDDPDRLPFDQHELIALMAPRPVLLSNATDDQWANPSGQFDMLRAADPVYKLLGAGGIDVKEMPPLGQLVDSKLGYFIRAGKHSTTTEDWKAFLDFADRHLGKAK